MCQRKGNELHGEAVSHDGKRTSQKDRVTGGETYFTQRPCNGRGNVRHMEARSGKVHHGESVSKEGKRT